jgi:glycerol-3-phosphate acyltransferase PlsY
MDSIYTVLVLALAIGYLLGSIPFGLILTKAAGAGDVRDIGSGSIGATNVLRTGHKGLAAATLLLDMLKGTVAVLLVERIIGAPAGYAIVSTFAAGLGAFRCGSASAAAKGWRPTSACSWLSHGLSRWPFAPSGSRSLR